MTYRLTTAERIATLVRTIGRVGRMVQHQYELVAICFDCGRASAVEVICSVCRKPMAYSIPEDNYTCLRAFAAEWLTLKLLQGPLELHELQQAARQECLVSWEILHEMLYQLGFVKDDLAFLPEDHPMRGEDYAAVRL